MALVLHRLCLLVCGLCLQEPDDLVNVEHGMMKWATILRHASGEEGPEDFESGGASRCYRCGVCL